MNHTPGPWTVKGDGQQVFCDTGLIADCAAQWHDDDDEEGLEADANRNSANALFIAAAPDLLDAAKVALESLMAWSTTGFHWGDEDIAQAARESYRGSPEVRKLEAAIAKAEGR